MGETASLLGDLSPRESGEESATDADRLRQTETIIEPDSAATRPGLSTEDYRDMVERRNLRYPRVMKFYFPQEARKLFR